MKLYLVTDSFIQKVAHMIYQRHFYNEIPWVHRPPEVQQSYSRLKSMVFRRGREEDSDSVVRTQSSYHLVCNLIFPLRKHNRRPSLGPVFILKRLPFGPHPVSVSCFDCWDWNSASHSCALQEGIFLGCTKKSSTGILEN